MKIAIMVTGHMTTPQPLGVTYAPMDLAVTISEGLQELGHEVDYYGPEGTHLKVPTVTCDLKPFTEVEPGVYGYADARGQEWNIGRLWDEYLIGEMIRRTQRGDYDVLLIHASADRGLPLGCIALDVPMIYTLHDPISSWSADVYRKFLTPNQHLVSISDSQRKPALDLSYLATVYNGVDIELFPFVETSGDHLLFAGRMVPEKNALDAITAARNAGATLKLFGEIPTDAGKSYFENKISPQLGDGVTYEGFLARKELAKQYGAARAVLVPIRWEEPFGMVLVEAMACGTPVIAFRHGSVPEIIVDGKTGFIVDTVEEMIEAIKKIDTIDRQACRSHVLEKFSGEQMIKGYEAAAKSVLSELL